MARVEVVRIGSRILVVAREGLCALARWQQRRHVIILLAIIEKPRGTDKVGNLHESILRIRILERLLVNEEGREAREVKLGLDEGLLVREEEMAKVLDVAAEIVLAEEEALLGAGTILAVLVLHDNVITLTANRNEVVRHWRVHL